MGKPVAIPKHDTLMLPLLKFARDGEEHSLREAIEVLRREFNLTEEDSRELLPSGRLGKTRSTRWAALSAMRRPPHEGQKPLPLHENATNRSLPHASQCTRRKPWARMPQAR
jgi:restriction endonuclease Mrr